MSEQVRGLRLGRRQFIAGSLATGALLALAGCGKKVDGGSDSKPSSNGGQSGGELRVHVGNPVCIEPFDAQESEGTQICQALFDSLTEFDFRNSKVVGVCAESWEANADATQFTFHLRQGMKFHNGDPVTSKDFKFSWERIVNPKTTDTPSVISYHIDAVEGFEAMLKGEATELSGLSCPDDNTFVVKLSKPYGDFPAVCSHPALAPVPMNAKCSGESYRDFAVAPIGNGPFMMDGKWEDGQYVKVKTFADYYGEKPKIDSVLFKIHKDPKTAWTEFQAGNLDVTDIQQGQYKQTISEYGEAKDGYTANPKEQAITGPQLATYYIVVNNTRPQLDNVKVRKALSYAINRQAICDTVFEGSRVPATGIVPKGIGGFQENAWEACQYDVEKAKSLLAEAGASNLSFKLTFNQEGDHTKIMELVQSDLAAVGVKVEFEVLEWKTCLQNMQNGDYDMGRLGWVADYPIMDNFLYPLFYTGVGDNRCLYSNPKFDEGVNEARKVVDEIERYGAYRKLEKMVGEDLPVIPLFYYRHAKVASKRVSNLYLAPNQLFDFTKCTLQG